MVLQMATELNICMAGIGLHLYRHSKVKGLRTLNNFELVVFLAMLYQSGDIEKNPGPNSACSTESDDSWYAPLIKVRKMAKITKRYNQVPHLTQDYHMGK